jgi:hypothetical protein
MHMYLYLQGICLTKWKKNEFMIFVSCYNCGVILTIIGHQGNELSEINKQEDHKVYFIPVSNYSHNQHIYF